MTIKALFFAHYQDVVGSREQSVSLPDHGTVRTLADVLETRYPRLGNLLAQGRVAVNAEFAEESLPLRDGDEVAWMPPMSGGRGGC